MRPKRRRRGQPLQMLLRLELPSDRRHINIPKLDYLGRRATHLCGEWGCVLRAFNADPQRSILLLEARTGTTADQLSTCFDEINATVSRLFDEFAVGCDSNF